MAAGQLDSVLHHLRTLLPSDSDGELLQRFAARGDASAFAGLVQRHGRLVWGVCRHVLHHHHDAEDAFQATFLVLARNAASIRNTTAVASWLHGVAYRTAMRAKRDAARRRARERRAALPPEKETAGPSLRDLQAVLDEEVHRLPEKLRAPFVLCCLSGKSMAEAAQTLGCPVGTVSGRLTRARKTLRQRLARRGVALAAVLCVTEIARGAAPPAALSRAAVQVAQASTGAVGGGLASPEITALAEGVSKTMFATRPGMLTSLLLTLGLLAAGSGYRLSAVGPRPSAPPPKVATRTIVPKDDGRKNEKGTFAVRGRILGPGGKPVANARLYWPRLLKPEPKSADDIAFVHVGSSDVRGHFRLKLTPLRAPWKYPIPLLAVADGYGMDWVELSGTRPKELALTLVKDQPIHGRVLSTEGKPVVGAGIRVTRLFTMTDGKLDAFLAAWKREWGLAFQKTTRQLSLPLKKALRIAPTDKEGRFEVHGVGAGRLVALQVDGAGLAREVLYVVNRAGFDPAPYNKAARERVPPQLRRSQSIPKLYGPTLKFVAELTRPVEGVVREVGTGKPLAGVQLLFVGGFNNSLHAFTDAKGRYKILGLPRRKEYRVHALPPTGSSLLANSARVADSGGLEPLKLDVELARGVVLTGRVRDRTTGKGVPAGLRFVPLPGNKFFGKPGYNSYRYERLTRPTDGDGRFRLVVLPGSGVLLAQVNGGEKFGDKWINPYTLATIPPADRKRLPTSDDGDGTQYFKAANNSLEFLSIYNTCKVLDLKGEAGTVTCNLFVERGKTKTVHVQDVEGKPLTGATIAGMTASWPMTFALKQANCTVYALDPARPRLLVFYHVKRKLAGTLVLRGDEKVTPTVRLAPAGSIRGRLLDLDGEPIAGVAVTPVYGKNTARELERQLLPGRDTSTDKAGRFLLKGVIPGLKLGLSLRHGRGYLYGEPRIGQQQVASGKILDLGNRRVKPGN